MHKNITHDPRIYFLKSRIRIQIFHNCRIRFLVIQIHNDDFKPVLVWACTRISTGCWPGGWPEASPTTSSLTWGGQPFNLTKRFKCISPPSLFTKMGFQNGKGKRQRTVLFLRFKGGTSYFFPEYIFLNVTLKEYNVEIR